MNYLEGDMGLSRVVGHMNADVSSITGSQIAGPVEDTMWFRKPAPVVCAACGKSIAPRERRFVEKKPDS